jgi:protease I
MGLLPLDWRLADHSNQEETMAAKLNGKRIAIFATDGFEQAELTKPLQALREAGAEVDIVSLEDGEIQGMEHDEKGDKIAVDVALADADAEDYDALVLPGGVANPDRLRADEDAVTFVDDFVTSGKPIAAICHGPWTLIETGFVEGKRMTSWPSLKTDLRNAGAEWVDREVVRDGLLVTSRKPDDLPAFCDEIIDLFANPEQAQNIAAE